MSQRRNEDPRHRGYGSPHEGSQQDQSPQPGGSQIGGWSEQPGGQASPGSQQHTQYSGSSGQYGGIPSGPAGSPYGTPYARSYGDEQPYGSQPTSYGGNPGRPQSGSPSADTGGAPYGQYGGEYGQYGQSGEQAGFRGQDPGRFQQPQRGPGPQRWGQGDFGFPQQGRDAAPGPGRERGWNAQDFRGFDQERENERRYGGHYGAVDDPSRIRDYGDRDTARSAGAYGQPDEGRPRQDWNPQRAWNQRSREDQQQRSEARDWGTYGYPNRDDIYSQHSAGQGSQPQPQPHSQPHHDPDYHQWRAEQLQNFDSDYQNWRQERYRKFSEEFNDWRRRNASQRNAVPSAQTSAGGPDTEKAQASTRAALGGAAAGSEGGDLTEQQAGSARPQATPQPGSKAQTTPQSK